MASLSIDDVSIKGDKLLNHFYVMQNYSTVTVTVATTKRCILKIKNKNGVLAQTTSSNSITFVPMTAGTYWVEVDAIDSSGVTETLSTEGKKTLTVLPYFKPQITEFTCVRKTSDAIVEATVKGIAAYVTDDNNQPINGRKAVVNLNGKTLALSSSSYEISGDSYVINGSVTFTDVSTSETLTFVATVSDDLNTVAQDYVLSPEAVTMDFHHSGKGVAFGKVAEDYKDDEGNDKGLLDVAWDAKFGGKVIVDADWVDLDITDGFKVYGTADDLQNNILQCKSIGCLASIRGVLTVDGNKHPDGIETSRDSIQIASGIPEDCCPTKNVRVVCQGSDTKRWLCTITTSGSVMLARYGTTEYETISSGVWLPINITYLI